MLLVFAIGLVAPSRALPREVEPEVEECGERGEGEEIARGSTRGTTRRSWRAGSAPVRTRLAHPQRLVAAPIERPREHVACLLPRRIPPPSDDEDPLG
jgi:hypothetical protein